MRVFTTSTGQRAPWVMEQQRPPHAAPLMKYFVLYVSQLYNGFPLPAGAILLSNCSAPGSFDTSTKGKVYAAATERGPVLEQRSEPM
mmetsp:Transcript_20319/g.51315  ORF Transcript_20319/g.51315 Transcript_20319/m.51315 type:complete len:87 (-) Transcript_20319:64-324(-)